MLNISGLNKQSLGRFLDKLRANYIESGQDPMNERYTHGPTIVLIEGLISAGKYMINLGGRFDRWLERPRDPLTPEQVETLKGLEDVIEGLSVSADGQSLKKDTPPTILYADYKGEFLGTCYGRKFDVFAKIDDDKRKQEVVAKIMEAYLPDESDN